MVVYVTMSTKLQIIGLSGTNGSGKDSMGELLAEHHGYLFVSVTELLRDEARHRGLPVTREHLRAISAEWRREQGLATLVDRAVALYHAAGDKYAGIVMASLRNPYEADRIHELGGTMVWVDSDPAIRYARIQANATTRGRVDEDRKTFEEFLSEEQAEMQQSGDAATLNMGAVKERSDVTIYNNGDDLKTFAALIDRSLDFS
jgi:cytidylate kinase